MGKFDGGFGSGAGAGSPGGADVAVADGGTGRSTATAYMPLAGGTTATGAHQSVAAGSNNGEALTYQGASALPSFSPVGILPGVQWVDTQHYLTGDGLVDGAIGGLIRYSGTGSGAGAGVSYLPSYDGKLGVAKMTTGTATGKATLYTPHNAWLRLGVVAVTLKVRFQIETLSDGTDTYVFRVGLNDTTSVGGDGTNGVFLRYTHNVNSGKFELVTRNNGVETATDTGVTVAIGTWYEAEFAVAANGSSVACTINGAPAGAPTTNIPNSSGRETAPEANIIQSVGTNPRNAYVDYWHLKVAC